MKLKRESVNFERGTNMFFGFSDRADRNGDGRVDIWEAAEELYAYDSIMGTNISGFCPENDDESDDCDEW